MAPHNTGKRATSESRRVPSQVRNDYNHLGVPGSLDLPLNDARRGRARRRVQARRRGGIPAWGKALLALGGGALAFGIVALVIGIIAFPPFFRNLEPRYQQRLIDMFPPLDALRPTVPFEVLPTLGGANDNLDAQQLLLTQDTTPLAETPDPNAPLASDDIATDSPTITPTGDSGIPVGAVSTPEPTMLPTYVAPTQAIVDAGPGPTWTPNSAPTSVPLPAAFKLDGFRYEQQGWNNCGPTTMTMALSHFGWSENQYTAAAWMKPHSEDKNVSPWQMVRFVNENSGVKALYRYGGNTTLLKRLIAARFPVVIEESIQPAEEGWMGHYTLLIGYDDSQQHFLLYDSYLGSGQGQGKPHPYSIFDENWRHFNRVFMVIYEPSREMELREVLGDYVDPEFGYRVALETSRAEAAKNSADKWAWFNMGTSLVGLGDFDNAAIAFDQALDLGLPFRMLWYQFGPYEAYFKTGRFNDVMAYTNATLGTTKYVEETYYWQGMVLAAQGERSQALSKFDEALRYNKNFYPAQEAKAQVENGTFQVASASR